MYKINTNNITFILAPRVHFSFSHQQGDGRGESLVRPSSSGNESEVQSNEFKIIIVSYFTTDIYQLITSDGLLTRNKYRRKETILV